MRISSLALQLFLAGCFLPTAEAFTSNSNSRSNAHQSHFHNNNHGGLSITTSRKPSSGRISVVVQEHTQKQKELLANSFFARSKIQKPKATATATATVPPRPPTAPPPLKTLEEEEVPFLHYSEFTGKTLPAKDQDYMPPFQRKEFKTKVQDWSFLSVPPPSLPEISNRLVVNEDLTKAAKAMVEDVMVRV